MVILVALAKLGSFVKDVLVSLQFGASLQTDAYFVANAVPGFVFGGVFATIGLVFLPAFQRATAESEHAASVMYRTAAVGYTALSAFLAAAMYFEAPLIISTLAPDLNTLTHDQAVMMTRVMAFSFVFSGWVGLQNAVLQSHKLLIWPQLVQIVNHTFVIGGLALAAIMSWSIIALVYAAVLGWIVAAPLVSLRARVFWPKTTRIWFDRHTAVRLAALSFPVFLGLSLDQVTLLIGTYLGSSFPEGAISHFNYAQRLTMFLSSVFALIISYVLFPYLTESIVVNNLEKTKRYLGLALIAATLVTTPLLIISFVMGEALIFLIFQRGAFEIDDTVATGKILVFFAPIIVLVGIREVLNRLFLALQKTETLLIFGIFAMITNAIASVYFSRKFGIEGIALGSTFGACIYVFSQVVLVVVLHRNMLGLDLLIWLGAICLAGSAATLFGQWINSWAMLVSAKVEVISDAILVIGLFVLIIAIQFYAFPRMRHVYRVN